REALNVGDVPRHPQVLVHASGVQRLRRRSQAIRYLPHNYVRDAHSIMGLNFRTKVLKWNVFDVLHYTTLHFTTPTRFPYQKSLMLPKKMAKSH
ncbi:MAG: hypothetical protein RR061_08875, partial [Muribaculaceae bacterium]